MSGRSAARAILALGIVVATVAGGTPAWGAEPEAADAPPRPDAPADLVVAGPPPPATPARKTVQITGRVIYTWLQDDGVRVILAIDGFTVLAGDRQVTAQDGVVWFDEEAGRRTGKAVLGVFAETDVEVRTPGGGTARYDSVYLAIPDGDEVLMHSDLPLRGTVEATPLYLRAKKRRKEYLEGGQAEPPREVVPPPPDARPPVPGLREAGVPEAITIVPRDDVSQVNFASRVVDGVRVSTWTGGVYVLRGEMEMTADSLVLWAPEGAVQGAVGEDEGGQGGPSAAEATEAYFEGHVQIVAGRRRFFCDRLYYDFGREQALAVNVKIRTFSTARNIPVYYYAEEVRQVARNVFVGTDAAMTTDEFAVPNYAMGAARLKLVDLTPEPPEDAPEGERIYRKIRFLGENVHFSVREMPLLWWPKMGGTVAEGETALRTVRVTESSNRGTGFRAQWHLLRLFGIDEPPEGHNYYLNTDYWSERGPGLGVEGNYWRETHYGDLLGYILRDLGEDSIGGDDREPPRENRGRLRWRHRHYLPQDWEMTLELSYLSDDQFLNEFYEQEDEEQKAQETLLYLKKVLPDEGGLPSDQVVTVLTSWRLNDWYTRTEYLPRVGYDIIGHSLLDDRLTYFQDSEIAHARYRAADGLPRLTSQGTFLADSVHELDLPLRAGPVGIVPYAMIRGSAFEEDLAGDTTWRMQQRAGVRASLQAWRVFPGVDSAFFDLHGLRHIHTWDVDAFASNVTAPPGALIPFDPTEAGTPEVQGVNDIGTVALGWRQRFQTKRGPPEFRSAVDWLTLDLEAFFHDDRSGLELDPTGKQAFNHLDFRADWAVTGSVGVWADVNHNLGDGTLDMAGVGMSVAHTPRLNYHVGHRLIPDGDTSRSFIGADYRINTKWHIAFLEQYDWDRGENAQSHIVLTRRLNRWLARFRLELDPGEDETYVGVELEPMGAPEVRLGM